MKQVLEIIKQYHGIAHYTSPTLLHRPFTDAEIAQLPPYDHTIFYDLVLKISVLDSMQNKIIISY